MTKKLSRFDILALALGSIIGWGSFTLPGSKFLNESGIISTAIGFLLGGIAITFIQKGYHVMMRSHFEDGGEFSYTYTTMGKPHGFLVGWSLILAYLSMVPLNATAFVLVLKRIFGEGLNYIYLYEIAGYPVYLSEILIASAIIILFAFINIKGLKVSSRVQNVMIMIMMANIVVIFTYMIFTTDLTQMQNTYFTGYTLNFSQIAKVFAVIPFLFVGFDVIPQMATDLGFEQGKATKIAIIAIFAGVVFYNLNNIITGMVYAPGEAKELEWALGTAVLNHMGTIGFGLLALSLAGAVAGGINGFTMAGSKLAGAMATYGFLPEKLSLVNKQGVFHHGVKFIAAVSLLAPWFGRAVIIYIVDMSSLLAAITYFYVCYIAAKSVKGMEKIQATIGAAVSLSFIALLVIPGSPGRLSGGALIALAVWTVLGLIYYTQHRSAKDGPDIEVS
ncbi:MAG: APC family permease [Clostridium sp.]|jgi:amino acid transporter|nr:APC family permease [Clostridium sp.]